MQRRLFILFLLLTLIPAIVVLAVNWQLSQRHLEFLDSPGLGEALESSLELARAELRRRETLVAAALDSLPVPIDRAMPPIIETGDLLAVVNADSMRRVSGPIDRELHAAVRAYAANPGPPTSRLTLSSGSWVAAARSTPEGVLVLARPLPASLDRQLAAVSQGGARIRQLRLYYGDLLRSDTLTTLGILGLIVLAASLALSRVLAQAVSRPIRALAEATRRIAEGDLEHRVDVEAPAELGQLVEAFNRMTDDLRTSKQDLIQAERVAAWQGVARRLAHEIKNPLTPITLAMHRIGRRSEDPAVVDSVQTVLEETANLKRLADEFSQYARLPAPEPEAADLLELARSVVQLYGDRERLQVVWESELDRAPVRVDPGQMRQTLANLVQNAVAAIGGEGRLTFGAAREGERIVLTITDTGPGLGDDPERIFEPYFTTKATGTGLGLPIARKIVEDHHGRLTARNSEAGGAELRLELPAAEERT